MTDPAPGQYFVRIGSKVPEWFARKKEDGRPRPTGPHFRYAVSFWEAPLAFDAVITLHSNGTAEITAAYEGQIIAGECSHHFVAGRCYACGVRTMPQEAAERA